MAEVNVVVSVTDPDRLRAGTHPLAPFDVRVIEVYRYTSESAARDDTDGSGGTLVDGGSGYTWELVASSTEVETPNIAGPYRYGIYDENQAATSWYRYRFGNADQDTFTLLSRPWRADEFPLLALRDVLAAIGQELGGAIISGTAETNANADEVVCTKLWESTKRDSRFYEAWWLLCSEDAAGGGAAPEGEEAMIDSVDRDTGTATLERDLSAAITDGDTILLSAFLSFEEIIQCVNRAREEMEYEETVDIALTAGENRYPAPWGVRAKTDIYDAVGVIRYGGSGDNQHREQEFEIGYDVVRSGGRYWIDIAEWPQVTAVARLSLVRNYRESEGDLVEMGDTTEAPMEWLRVACAYKVAEYLQEQDPDEPEYAELLGRKERDAKRASGRYAPDIVRRVNTGSGRRILPGPVER